MPMLSWEGHNLSFFFFFKSSLTYFSEEPASEKQALMWYLTVTSQKKSMEIYKNIQLRQF